MHSSTQSPWTTYLLRGNCGRRTYIGASPSPAHRQRLQQHNGKLSGGAAPSAGRPWQLVLVVHGFTSKQRALAFESAWQKPHANRHTKRMWAAHNYSKCTVATRIPLRFIALSMLLEHTAWAESKLSVHVHAPELCGHALQKRRK